MPTLQTKSLFLSAGHSYSDTGAVGNGHTEADIVTVFRDAVCDELDAKGIVYQRDGFKGQNLPLREAIKSAQRHDVAIEFHCNAFSDPSATGVETLPWDEDFPHGVPRNRSAGANARADGRTHQSSGQSMSVQVTRLCYNVNHKH